MPAEITELPRDTDRRPIEPDARYLLECCETLVIPRDYEHVGILARAHETFVRLFTFDEAHALWERESMARDEQDAQRIEGEQEAHDRGDRYADDPF